MIIARHVVGFLAVAIPVIAGAGQEKNSLQMSIDPGGCVLEHIAVNEGIREFQYDSLSADGTRLAVGYDRGEEDRGTYILDLASGERKPVPGFNNGAVFAPDGQTLVNAIYDESGKTEIVEHNLQSGETTAIAPHPQWDWLASYSSDGGTILFNSYRSGASDIYTYSKASGELKQWTSHPGYEAHAQFSPDDSKILFHRQEENGDFNIHVIDTDTGEETQLTDGSWEESYASWSPDGEAIVFAADRGREPGKTDLYLMDKDGKNTRRLTDHEAKDAYPFFSPDGKHLYFNSYREPEGIFRITLDDTLNCAKSSD